MKSFDRALEDCLELIRAGQSLDACMRRYPEYAGELLPLLRTALELQQGSLVQPPEAFKRRARAGLSTYMLAHPRQGRFRGNHRETTVIQRSKTSPLLRPVNLAIAVFSVVVFGFFASGTALAQSALPGESLYQWKLTSETVWRTVSPDPVATNLALAQRRSHEAQAVSGPQRDVALQGYEEVLNRLATQTQADPAADQRVVPVLKTQQDELEKSGIKVKKLDDYLDHPRHKSEHPTPKHKPKGTPSKADSSTPTPTLPPSSTLDSTPTPPAPSQTMVPLVPQNTPVQGQIPETLSP